MFNSYIPGRFFFDDLTESEYLQDDLMMILEKCSKERHASEFTIFDNDRLDKNSFSKREIFLDARKFLLKKMKNRKIF